MKKYNIVLLILSFLNVPLSIHLAHKAKRKGDISLYLLELGFASLHSFMTLKKGVELIEQKNNL